MTVKTRRSKIKQQSQKVMFVFSPKFNVKVYGQPSQSDQDARYQQRITWSGKDTKDGVPYLKVSCQCHKTSSPGVKPCKGNSNGHNCTHTLADLTFAARESGKIFVPFDYFHEATNYANLNGQVIKINSIQGRGKSWGVVK